MGARRGGHGHRYPAGGAGDSLRRVPAGRIRRAQRPRRHGTGVGDCPQAGARSGGNRLSRERPGEGVALHTAAATGGPGRGPRAGAGDAGVAGGVRPTEDGPRRGRRRERAPVARLRARALRPEDPRGAGRQRGDRTGAVREARRHSAGCPHAGPRWLADAAGPQGEPRDPLDSGRHDLGRREPRLRHLARRLRLPRQAGGPGRALPDPLARGSARQPRPCPRRGRRRRRARIVRARARGGRIPRPHGGGRRAGPRDARPGEAERGPARPDDAAAGRLRGALPHPGRRVASRPADHRRNGQAVDAR